MIKNLAKVEQAPDFSKDMETGAVINTNVAALKTYRARRKTIIELEDTKSRLGAIELELLALKELISNLKN